MCVPQQVDGSVLVPFCTTILLHWDGFGSVFDATKYELVKVQALYAWISQNILTTARKSGLNLDDFIIMEPVSRYISEHLAFEVDL